MKRRSGETGEVISEFFSLEETVKPSNYILSRFLPNSKFDGVPFAILQYACPPALKSYGGL